MSFRSEWHELNQRYLTIALQWLRLKLSGTDDSRIELMLNEMHVLEHTPEPPALAMLAEQFGLSEFEKQLLLLSCSIEYDTSIPKLCAEAHADSNSPYPTFSLALAKLDSPEWDIVAPERPLRYWQMIDIRQNENVPLISRQLRADERIVNYVKGLNHLDARLIPYVKRIDAIESQLPASHIQIVDQLEESIRKSLADQQASRSIVVQLAGEDRLGKEDVAGHLSRRLGLQSYALSACLLPSSPIEIDLLSRLWRRETSLLPLCLYVTAYDDPAEVLWGRSLRQFLTSARTIAFIDVSEPLDGVDNSNTCDVYKPTHSEQSDIWRDLIGTNGTESIVGQLVSQFHLSANTIRKVASSALQVAPKRLSEQLWNGCRAVTRPKLDRLTQRIDVKSTWDDLVLPETQHTLLRQVASQVRHRAKVYDEWGFRKKMNRGLGISALFAGPSGTGKTMAAEVLANDLQMDLYRVDLSAVVNKYIGETEKNLRRVFDAADEGGVILFFDEADALFGKRTEVSDSHDRYANIEVNYLLQRMESYRGLAILATNMKSTLDKAFLRRLRFIIDMPMPTANERKEIWRRAFPAEMPLCELDYDALSRLKITGGNIHSISLAASFQSAASPGQDGVSMSTLKSAIETEMLKLEKPSVAIDLSNNVENDWPSKTVRSI